jgi:DNA helicase-2/ATP-dependent DNA helicase PcrA
LKLLSAGGAAGCSLHDAVSATTGKAGANLTAFAAKIDQLREQTLNLTLREIIDMVLQASGLIEHYKSEREGADRIENLEELVNAAESFVTQEGFGRDAVALPVDELSQSPVSQGLDPNAPSPQPSPANGRGGRELLPLPPGEGGGEGAAPGGARPGLRSGVPPDAETGETLSPLAAFLTHAALESGDNQAQAGQDAIQLMTVHSAKGLEFDCVFISGLEEGLFPHENSLSDHEGLEEERRLMYVAITRARKRLYLSHAQTRLLHGQTRYNVKSRFFDELPEGAMKWLTPKNQKFVGSAFGFGGGYATSRGATAGSRGKDVFASPPVPARKSPSHGLRADMKVFHTKFGEGTVMSIEGQGDDARAQVNFPRHGVKWLALSVARLTPVT